jgi:hypothetical protein
MDDAFDPNRTILHGVEQPGIYDGILYWIDTDGYAFHRFTTKPMIRRAQPFIDTYNAGRTFLDNTDTRGKGSKL